MSILFMRNFALAKKVRAGFLFLRSGGICGFAYADYVQAEIISICEGG